VIKNFIETLAPSGYMRYSADGMSRLPVTSLSLTSHVSGHFVFSSFASAFLLKVSLLVLVLEHALTIPVASSP
jgi:hypothetical protein